MSILSPPDPPSSIPPQGLDQGAEAAVASPSTLTAPLLVPAQKERQEENDGDDEEERVEGKEEHIFDELPSAKVLDASRPESHDIGQFQLVYTIQLRYKQVRSFGFDQHIVFFSFLLPIQQILAVLSPKERV
jgi:hypothetical protein